ncbi:MAG: hypothetical protein DRJ42_21325 [Deltaproteobacteria bacterium]|nr:MAG: hypothetical protein DRJ42_21325 [Deltaproteobacteria bacterium]
MTLTPIPWLALALCAIAGLPAVASAQTCTEVTIDSPTPRDAGARSAASCSGCDAEGRVTITFRFDREVPCGDFVDGSPWVVDDGAGVAITAMEPAVTRDCGADVCNGWMLNVSGRGQALDGRRDYDMAAAPPIRDATEAAPFTATAGDSILKAVSFQDEAVGTDCSGETAFGRSTRHCLYFAGVLTVLGEAPPDGGANTFRPPYVGTDRPIIPVSDANMSLLPSLPAASVDSSCPDVAAAETALCQVPLSFMGTYANQFFKGYLNTNQSASGYHGHVSRSYGDYLLRALFDDRTDRMAHCLIQRGIDLYHMLLPPVETSWGPNGGHGQGRTMWPVLAAAVLGRADWATNVESMSPGRFAERSQIYWSPIADPTGDFNGPGEVLYGAHPAAGGTSMCTTGEYFGRCYPDWPGSCNRVCGDPFGYIDGGPPGDSYQQIFTPAARAYSLAGRLIPALGAAWPRDDGHALMLEYTDRWVEHGAWALPDPCDPADPLDSMSPSDCTSSPVGACLCNPGSGRYPAAHGMNADGGSSYRSACTTAIWGTFRSCADDCSCPGMMEELCDLVPPPSDGGVDVDGGGPPPMSDGGGTTDDSGTAPPDGDDEGCGCSVVGASPDRRAPVTALAFGLVAVVLSLRRRSRGSRRRPPADPPSLPVCRRTWEP